MTRLSEMIRIPEWLGGGTAVSSSSAVSSSYEPDEPCFIDFGATTSGFTPDAFPVDKEKEMDNTLIWPEASEIRARRQDAMKNIRAGLLQGPMHRVLIDYEKTLKMRLENLNKVKFIEKSFMPYEPPPPEPEPDPEEEIILGPLGCFSGW